MQPAEMALFRQLPDALQEGWQTEHEGWGYVDTPVRLEMRLALVRVHDPDMQRLRTIVQQAQTVEEVANTIMSMDLSSVDDNDLASLMFGMGPTLIGQCMLYALRSAASDEDINRIAALSFVRHSILASFAAAAHGSR
jgi:hypothetical protein